jgi:hypothetical protein
MDYFLKNTAIRKLSRYLIAVFFLSSCGNNKILHDTGTVTKISYKTQLPIVNLSGEMKYIKGNITFYYAKEYTVYKLPTYDLDDEGINKITNNSYNFFVVKNNESIGYIYDTLIWDNLIKRNNRIFNKSNWRKINADSTLKGRGFIDFNVYNLVMQSKLAYSKTENNINSLIRVYTPTKIIDESYNDTTFLYFSKSLKNIVFSFSRQLDSVENLKLVKIRLLSNEKFSQQYKIILPKREFVFEINKLPATDSSEIIELLEKVFY